MGDCPGVSGKVTWPMGQADSRPGYVRGLDTLDEEDSLKGEQQTTLLSADRERGRMCFSKIQRWANEPKNALRKI